MGFSTGSAWLPLVAALVAAAPAAAEMPRYDMAAYCLKAAPHAAACPSREQAAYEALQPVWGSLSQLVRNYCDRFASDGDVSSYEILRGCVKRHLEALEENRHFHLTR